MSTFVLRFVGDTSCAFRGRIRHIGTGDEASFRSVPELLAFVERMNAVQAPPRAGGASDRAPSGRARASPPPRPVRGSRTV